MYSVFIVDNQSSAKRLNLPSFSINKNEFDLSNHINKNYDVIDAIKKYIDEEYCSMLLTHIINKNDLNSIFVRPGYYFLSNNSIYKKEMDNCCVFNIFKSKITKIAKIKKHFSQKKNNWILLLETNP